MVTHPNQTQFDEFSPLWLSLGMILGFLRFQNMGMGRVYIGTHPEPIHKPVPNTENYFMLICLVILFDNCRVIKTIIDI